MCRRRCINEDHFLIQTFKEYISQKGLPNQREPLFQDEVERYEISVIRSESEIRDTQQESQQVQESKEESNKRKRDSNPSGQSSLGTL